jgi:hypothetical protein
MRDKQWRSERADPCARVEHVGAKEALLADDPDVFFTTPHFDGYAAILVRVSGEVAAYAPRGSM